MSQLFLSGGQSTGFSFNISPSNEYSELISFRMDWLDLLAVQGTLKSLLQHHSSEASVLRCSAFFMVQFSHLYMTTGKTIALTRQTFVGNVMSLIFNTLEKEMAVHCSTLAREIPWPEEPGGLQSLGPQGVGVGERGQHAHQLQESTVCSSEETQSLSP